MKAVALDPDYARKMSRRFAGGGLAGHLYLNSKKWLGYRDQVCKNVLLLITYVLNSIFCLLTIKLPRPTLPKRFCTLVKVQYMLWNGEQVLLLGLMMQEWRFMILPMTSVLHLLKNHGGAHALSFCFLTWFGRLVKYQCRHAVDLCHSIMQCPLL